MKGHDRTVKGARRFISLLLVFLLIGAAINVGLAWTAAIMFKPGIVERRPVEGPWPSAVPEDWPSPVIVEVERGFLASRETWSGPSPVPGSPEATAEFRLLVRFFSSPRYTLTRFGAGWPERSLQWDLWSRPAVTRWGEAGMYDVPRPVWRTGIRIGDDEPVSLPIMPIWRGFLVNTISFALAAIFLYTIPSALRCIRDSRRQVQNICPGCRYPRTGLPTDAVCPECGEPFPERT
jgi:hypothetical protein